MTKFPSGSQKPKKQAALAPRRQRGAAGTVRWSALSDRAACTGAGCCVPSASEPSAPRPPKGRGDWRPAAASVVTSEGAGRGSESAAGAGPGEARSVRRPGPAAARRFPGDGSGRALARVSTARPGSGLHGRQGPRRAPGWPHRSWGEGARARSWRLWAKGAKAARGVVRASALSQRATSRASGLPRLGRLRRGCSGRGAAALRAAVRVCVSVCACGVSVCARMCGEYVWCLYVCVHMCSVYVCTCACVWRVYVCMSCGVCVHV